MNLVRRRAAPTDMANGDPAGHTLKKRSSDTVDVTPAGKDAPTESGTPSTEQTGMQFVQQPLDGASSPSPARGQRVKALKLTLSGLVVYVSVHRELIQVG